MASCFSFTIITGTIPTPSTPEAGTAFLADVTAIFEVAGAGLIPTSLNDLVLLSHAVCHVTIRVRPPCKCSFQGIKMAGRYADSEFLFYIDVIAACNLRCPTCPIGNSPDVPYSQGLISPELLDRILTKAQGECIVTEMGLYNWTEPLLHPRLPELIRIVHSHEIRARLSANLNLARNLEAILRENPEFLRVTVSGFTQETYGITHRGGQIEKVKANLIELGRLKRELGATTQIEVGYLRYLQNLHEEEPMRQFAEDLGFEFHPSWAWLTPLEKVLGHRGEPGYTVPTMDDRRVMDMLAIPLDVALDATSKDPTPRCSLLEDQVTLDVNGNVQLCCAVYDPAKFTIANFLDTPLETIQDLRHAQTTCATCMKHGVHDYYLNNIPGRDELASENVARRSRRPAPTENKPGHD